jgi:uncharacterized protein YjbI with pentapeptide repeats
MEKVTQAELNEIIANHKKWLNEHRNIWNPETEDVFEQYSKKIELCAVIKDKDLSELVFKNADLRYSCFSGCYFKNTIFEYVDFTHANLCYSNFEEASFVGTKLLYTNLESTNFWNAIFLNGKSIRNL